ncbi:facilitated trehalose transporter Tret1-like [Sipha flava]|uniref:Facilitated trehalose transporter Tret1 n=1 Tax=Sipha flava TaxID=143950 RepID=A0A2S2Q6S1_9HEMI|nr:facilitated trehalose transporter Tret1-like [Sipha flava]
MSRKGVFRQILATLIATTSILISGMWLGWPSSVVEKFINHETDVEVNMNELSWIVSMMDLGNVISPLIAGYLMDRVGRKPSTVMLGPLFLATWLLTLYVPTTWSLYTARLMAGMGKGISYTVVPVFLGEIAGVNIRGALGSVFCVQLHLGFLIEAVVGPLISYRALNAMSAVVPVAFLVAAVWLSESPYYMLKRGRSADAAQCLQWYRCDADADVDAELRRMDADVRHEMENPGSFRELFTSRKDMRALGIVVMACVSQRAGGISCILAYSAIILPEPAPLMGRSGYVTLFGVALVVINLAAATLVDRCGRRPLLFGSEAAMAAITAAFAFYYWLAARGVDVSGLAWMPYLCHASFAVAFAAGVGFVPVVYLGEMFPVNIRSHCSAVASITLAFCSFATNKMFLIVSHRYGTHAMFCLFTVVNAAGAAYTYRYAIETKGKTFADIQRLLRDGDDGVKDGGQHRA